jgi:hypothetical protein
MRQNSTSGMGALHPILFFVFVYGISLFLAFFVCRSIYNAVNGDVATKPSHSITLSANSTAFR